MDLINERTKILILYKLDRTKCTLSISTYQAAAIKIPPDILEKQKYE